jgi:cell division protein FtsA
MSNTDKIVVGLDIGTTKICALVGVKNQFGKLEILGMGKSVSEGVSRGMVVNIDKTVDAIKKAIKEAEESAGIDIGVVNVGIAGQHIRSFKAHNGFTRSNTEDEISVADVSYLTQEMYKYVVPAGTQIIAVMPQEYMVDYQLKTDDPVGMPGTRLEGDFHIITAEANAVNYIDKSVKRSNLLTDELILEPIASSLAVLSEDEKQAGVVLVDIGGGTTDVAIFHDGIIRHTAVIPFGGNIITQDIKEGLQLLNQQAEALKVKFGSALSSETKSNEIVSIPGLRNREPKEISIKNLASIVECRMEEIIHLVNAEIHSSGYEKKLSAGIVITGGGSQLKHLKQLFEYKTGKNTRIGYPNEHLGKSKVEVVKSPMYATAVGLVLAGFYGIDERENKYKEKSQSHGSTAGTAKSQDPIILKNSEEHGGTKKETNLGFGLFKNMKEKISGMLIDDFDDKSNYE